MRITYNILMNLELFVTCHADGTFGITNDATIGLIPPYQVWVCSPDASGPTRDAKVGKIYLHPSMRDAIRSNVPELGGVSTHPLQLLMTTHLGDASSGVFYRSTVPPEYDSALDEVHLAHVDYKMGDTRHSLGTHNSDPIEMGDKVRLLAKETSGMHCDTSIFGGALVTLDGDHVKYTAGKGQGMHTVPMAMWAPEFADLGDLRMPSREKKNLIQLVKETRAADDTMIVTKWRNLSLMASRGGTYIRFFTKAWLDFMQTQLMEELGGCTTVVDTAAVTDWLIARVTPTPAPGPHECANSDTVEVENRASSVIVGDTFLCSGDYDELDDKFFSMVRRYAGTWPPEVATHEGKALSTSCVKIPGATRVLYLVGNSSRTINPIISHSLSAQEIMAFIDHYAVRVGAFEDAMIGFELAAAFGLRTRVGRLDGIASHKSVGIDAMWSNGGLKLPSDNTLSAFFQPFLEVENPSAEIHTLTTDSPHRVLALAARFHMWQSISTQTAWLAGNITKEMLFAAVTPQVDKGKSAVQINELTRLLGGSVRLPKMMMMQLACSVWMFGFRMRTNAIKCISFPDAQLCGTQFLRGVHGDKCVPTVWLGFEGLDVSFNMPDLYVPPLPGHVIKQTPIGGYPYEPQPSERDNAARLARAIAPLIDGAWIGDGGPAYSANFYAQVANLKKINWEKPTNRNLPKAATEHSLTYVHFGSDGVLLRPGQFPTFDPLTGIQQSWAVKWPSECDEAMRNVTFQRANSTRTYQFSFPFGAYAEDPSIITRLLPELVDMFIGKVEMEVKSHPIYNVEPSIASDAQLGSSAPGNDNRVDGDFTWRTVGGAGRSAGNRVSKSALYMKPAAPSGERVLTENRFEHLPIERSLKRSSDRKSPDESLTTKDEVMSAAPKPRLPQVTKPTDDEALDAAIRLAKEERELGIGSVEHVEPMTKKDEDGQRIESKYSRDDSRWNDLVGVDQLKSSLIDDAKGMAQKNAETRKLNTRLEHIHESKEAPPGRIKLDTDDAMKTMLEYDRLKKRDRSEN